MSAAPQRFDLREIAPQPWKNGAGVTREIAFGGVSAGDFDWRLSVAEVARDAPFSAFPGIDRCIVLLRGAGMRLRSPDGTLDHALTVPLDPFRFSGDVALDATLVDGPCRDFNVMTRRGAWRAEVSVQRGQGLLTPADVTMVMCVDGNWTVDGVTLEPMQGLVLAIPPAAGWGEGVSLLAVRLLDDRSP
ncbi:HutD/Ves family protein [Rhizobacter fulvus]